MGTRTDAGVDRVRRSVLGMNSKLVAPNAFIQHTGQLPHTLQVLLLMGLAAVSTMALLSNAQSRPWRLDGRRTRRARAAGTTARSLHGGPD